MRQRLFILFVLVLSMLIIAPNASAKRKGKKRGKAFRPGLQEEVEKNKKYSLVRITHHTGKVTFELIPDNKVKKRQEEVIDFYKIAKKSHKEARKKAEGSTALFTQETPKKPKFKILKTGLLKDSAKRYKEKYEESYYKKYPETKPEKEENEENAPKSEEGKSGRELIREAAEKNRKFMVVRVTHPDGKVTFEYMTEPDIKQRKEELADFYKLAMQDYKEAKKKAEKESTPFKKKPPQKPAVKVLKKGVTEESAKRYCKQYEESFGKKGSRDSEEQPPEKPAPAPKPAPEKSSK